MTVSLCRNSTDTLYKWLDHSKQMWEVWARSVAPQRGSLLSLMPADRYRVRPSVVLSYGCFTSTYRADSTGGSSACVKGWPPAYTNTTEKTVDSRKTVRTPDGTSLSTFCFLQPLSVSFLNVPEWLNNSRKAWSFPVNLWLKCAVVSMNLYIEYSVDIFLKTATSFLLCC